MILCWTLKMVARVWIFLVTLVGVIVADTAQTFPISAAAKTFQLNPGCRRTGRGEKGGKVIIQSYQRITMQYSLLQGMIIPVFMKRDQDTKAVSLSAFSHIRILILMK